VIPFGPRPAVPPPRDVASAIRAGQCSGVESCRLIVVGGGKGGTGKSLLTANLGVLAALAGRRVVLVDGDLGLANLHLLLNVEPQANLLSLLEPGWSAEHLASALPRRGPAGVVLLPGAAGVARLAGLNRGELRRLIQRLEPHLAEAELVLIDLSSGISPSTRLFLQAAQEIVVVANPEPSAMLDAYGVIKWLTESRHEGEIYLVMNRTRDATVADECARRMLATTERFLARGLRYLGWVPEDEAMILSVQRQCPVVLDSPQSAAAAALRSISRRLTHDLVPARGTLGAFFSTARVLLVPRERSTKSSCAL